MRSNRPSEMFGVVFITFSAIAFVLGYPLMGSIIWVIWYLLYGFVGLALYFNQRNKFKLSNALTTITMPFTLMPFRRTWYYWVKSWNAVNLKKLREDKILALAEKVDPKYLTSNKSKAGYYFLKAALSYDMKDEDKASENLELARRYADDEQATEKLNKLEEIMKG